VDDLYFWMDETDYFSFSEKPFRLVLLGSANFTFCSGSYICFGAEREKKSLAGFLVVFYILPMLAFQTVHSIATGNGEWNYRRSIGLYLDLYEKDKKQWILLEPAGYVPYFSGLKTIDEVGLVDKQIQEEIKKDKANYWINTVKKKT
jgi:hypothetical protein